MKHLLRCVICLLVGFSAGSGFSQTQFRGVNLSAAEFGYFGTSPEAVALNQLPGEHGTAYLYADASHVTPFMQIGMNTFRVPFRWERIQRTLGGPLDSGELARLTGLVDTIAGLGGNVIIDVHNYARFQSGNVMWTLGSPELPHARFAELWSSLATEFGGRDEVIFGLMNEPFGVTTEEVVSFTQLAINAVRATSADNLILVQGNGYSGGHSWNQTWYGTSNAEAMLALVDPQDRMAFEVHQYVDNPGSEDVRYSGLSDHVESAMVVPEQLLGFTDWLRTNGRKGFLGELGTPSSELGVEAMFNGIEFVEENSDVWLGWTLWGAGPWWDSDPDNPYHLSLNPNADGIHKPQIQVLEPFLVPEPGVIPLLLLAVGGWLILRRVRVRTVIWSACGNDAAFSTCSRLPKSRPGAAD